MTVYKVRLAKHFDIKVSLFVRENTVYVTVLKVSKKRNKNVFETRILSSAGIAVIIVAIKTITKTGFFVLGVYKNTESVYIRKIRMRVVVVFLLFRVRIQKEGGCLKSVKIVVRVRILRYIKKRVKSENFSNEHF